MPCMKASTEQLASVLKRARLGAGLSQAQVARMAGTSQSAIAAYETGSKRPNAATVLKILLPLRPRPSDLLKRHRETLLSAASAHHAGNVRVFGSVARGEDTPDSDIDLLVTFEPDWSLSDLQGLVDDLETIFGRGRVDLFSDGSLPPGSPIFAEAVPVAN